MVLIIIHTTTLETGIDVRKGINVGPGKFGKKNKLEYYSEKQLAESAPFLTSL